MNKAHTHTQRHAQADVPSNSMSEHECFFVCMFIQDDLKAEEESKRRTLKRNEEHKLKRNRRAIQERWRGKS